MLKVIQNAKIVYATQSENNFENYVYDIKESKGIDIKNFKKSRMMRSYMMRRSDSYNKFVDKELLGNEIKNIVVKGEIFNV